MEEYRKKMSEKFNKNSRKHTAPDKHKKKKKKKKKKSGQPKKKESSS